MMSKSKIINKTLRPLLKATYFITDIDSGRFVSVKHRYYPHESELEFKDTPGSPLTYQRLIEIMRCYIRKNHKRTGICSGVIYNDFPVPLKALRKNFKEQYFIEPIIGVSIFKPIEISSYTQNTYRTLLDFLFEVTYYRTMLMIYSKNILSRIDADNHLSLSDMFYCAPYSQYHDLRTEISWLELLTRDYLLIFNIEHSLLASEPPANTPTTLKKICRDLKIPVSTLSTWYNQWNDYGTSRIFVDDIDKVNLLKLMMPNLQTVIDLNVIINRTKLYELHQWLPGAIECLM